MTTPHTNQVYVVTGAASGMGLATAQLLLERGANLGLCDLNEAALDQFVASLPEDHEQRVIHRAVNVIHKEALSSFLTDTKQHFGKLDGIASFAGTGGHKLGKQLIWETDQAEYDFIMDLNVKALYYMLRVSLQPGFLSEPASIVHITSMYAERGFQNGAVFTASKHAANGLVKSAAMEVAQRKIRVNTVMPGAIDTPMLRGGRQLQDIDRPVVPMGRYGQSEEIAKVTAFLLSEEASYVTGSHYAVDGGANAAGRHE